MLETQLSTLLDDAPSGVVETLDLVSGFDEGLVSGFARLGEERAAALTALAGAMAATPLADRVAAAAEKIAGGSVTEEHLSVLAGARIALLGAVHDALLARLDTALRRTRATWPQPPTPNRTTSAGNLFSGCRSWLTELAIAGWRGVDHDLISSSDQVLQALLADPALRRLAVLTDGLATELHAGSPIGTMERLPVRRWADLWTRALLLSQAGAGTDDAQAAERVSGRLLILGVDVHEHSTAVQIQVHGVLESAGDSPSRLVRTSVAAAKVDTIVGPALWRLLANYPVLLGALAERRSLEITDLPLLDSGDLVWQDDRAKAGDPADPFVTARVQLADAVAPAVPPLNRHPVGIAEPVLVEGYTATSSDEHSTVTFAFGNVTIPVAVDRLPSCGPLTPQLVAASSACVGLLRWDGGSWSLQPLVVQATVKRKPVVSYTGDWAMGPTDPKVAKAEAKAGDAVAVLRERAGRLLRK
ncbi:hypothetical protein GCM10027280_19030 [Micromonospora polyrhachis]|uniref:Uncharacterized protein n=1 Tax=Micromonospora polyrhachis TaxID=1282883 RepID=A0A7W7SLI6_9ACTN|nr:hypothetical protein [Micromonospora polyrhachis]MBB4956999.1 hypothetical protein [Micromonospora polyrhachis]